VCSISLSTLLSTAARLCGFGYDFMQISKWIALRSPKSFHHSQIECQNIESRLHFSCMSEEDKALRGQVVGMRLAGATYKQIKAATGKSFCFIRQWCKRIDAGDTLEDRPRPGRPRKITPPIQSTLKKLIKETRSIRRTQQRLSATGVELSVGIIHRECQLLVDKRKPVEKPFRTPEHEARRLAFALANVGRSLEYWRQVFFSDEKMYVTFTHPPHVYVNKGDAAPIKPVVKHPPKIQIWAAISYAGMTPLHRINHRQKAADYVKLLEKRLLPYAKQLYSSSWTLMHDSTSHGIHGAKITRKWLSANAKFIDPWPANSPDLNPIENVWAMLSRAVLNRNPKSVDGYWRILRQEWKNIDLEKIRKLIDGMPRRLQAVIDAAGGNTKY
jgi:transposase